MFGFVAFNPLSPHFEGTRFHLASHELPNLILFDSELKFDGFKRRTVLPGHLHYPIDLTVSKLPFHFSKT